MYKVLPEVTKLGFERSTQILWPREGGGPNGGLDGWLMAFVE